jgi:ubiquinone/menaquinone biosynthesis C-methylase UbiE
MTRAERRAAQQAARAAALAERLASLLDLHGDERVVDVGCGTGAAVYALAPTAREVIGVDSDASMIEVARREAPANAGFELADGEQLPFSTGDFDVGTTLRTLHHTRNPDRLLAELVRVTKPGGTILVVDQLAPRQAEQARLLDEFEQARDPTTSHVLTEAELRGLLARLGLILGHAEVVTEPRDLDAYLDLAGCAGAAREQAIRLAPPGYEAAIGWFVLLRP